MSRIVPDPDDPSIDQYGDDLTPCFGLRERLAAIDDAYRALPIAERTPAALRAFAAEAIEMIAELADLPSPVLGQLVEAVRVAEAGKVHPLFAVHAKNLEPRPAQSMAAIQGAAAGALEYAFSRVKFPQNFAAEKIAETLANCGFAKPSGGHYDASSVLKWRVACIKGRHAGVEQYEEIIALLREHGASGFGLGLLRIMCEHYGVAARDQTNGKT